MIYSKIKKISDKRGDKIAIVDLKTGKSFTYSKLVNEIDHLAFGLKESGIKTGDLLAWYVEDDFKYISAFVASSKIGAIFVSINRANGIDFYLKLSPRAILVENDIQIFKNRHKTILRMDLLRRMSKKSSVSLHIPIKSEFRLLETSGTTGAPKLVCFNQENFCYDINSWVDFCQWKSSDVTLNIHDINVSHGIDVHVITSLFAGGKLILMKKNCDPDELVLVIQKERVTIFSFLPGQYHNILNYIKGISPKDFDFSKVRYAFCGGAYLPKKLVSDLNVICNLKIKRIYGATEFGMMLANLEDCDQSNVGMKSIGNVEVALHIPDEKLHGEIIGRFPGMSLGYFNDPKSTGEKFKNGWYYTGDIGYLDDQGYYWVKGRKTDAVLSESGWILTTEIEELILGNLPLTEITVVKNNDHAVTIFVKDTGFNGDKLSAEIKNLAKRSGLSEANILFVENIPKTLSGKPDRAKLHQMVQEGPGEDD